MIFWHYNNCTNDRPLQRRSLEWCMTSHAIALENTKLEITETVDKEWINTAWAVCKHQSKITHIIDWDPSHHTTTSHHVTKVSLGHRTATELCVWANSICWGSLQDVAARTCNKTCKWTLSFDFYASAWLRELMIVFNIWTNNKCCGSLVMFCCFTLVNLWSAIC